RYEYPISAVPGDTPRGPLGPRALPGQYAVKLTVNGKSYSEPLTIKMDPRVKTSTAGLTQMFQMQSRLAVLMTEASRALAAARSAHEQLQKLSPAPGSSLATAISDTDKKIAALLGGSPGGGGGLAQPTLPSVNGGIAALYGELDRADAAPTTAQHNALKEIE